jgi:adenylate cyclase class 2
MQKEIEIKFNKIDKESVRKKLKEVGAELIASEKLMRRHTFDLPDCVLKDLPENEYRWLRVRDEGDKITMTLKHLVDNDSADNVDEVEIIVSDFDEACLLARELGMYQKNYQESKRESWQYKDIEICIDTWPGLEPFVELEGPSEQSLYDLAIKLGFNPDDRITGSVDYVYLKELNVPLTHMNKVGNLTFENADAIRRLGRKEDE